MNVTVNSTWYDSPEHWVDGTDIDKMGRRAVEVLRDLIVNRHTEYNRFKYLFLRSLKNGIHLTRRQQQAIDLAIEARTLGITESTYIAEKLGIHRTNAYQLLRRADERMYFITYQNEIKIATFDDSMAIHSEHNTRTTIDIPNDDIDNVVSGRYVDCPTKPYVDECQGRAPARFGLCRTCYETYNNKKWYPDGMPEWVKELANSVRREARQEAREYLFRQRYGVDIDISDIM